MTPETEGGVTQPLRVMVVDARPERRELMRHLVEATGLAEPDVGEAGSGAEAVELLDKAHQDIAIVEIQPVNHGLDAIATLRRRSAALRIIVCSFRGDPATKALAREGGADAYLDKPVSLAALKGAFREFFPDALTHPAPLPQEEPQPAGR
jgi:CheY-like chemotaxis protein